MVCQGYRALTVLKVGTGIQGILKEKIEKKCPQKIRHGLLESDVFFRVISPISSSLELPNRII